MIEVELFGGPRDGDRFALTEVEGYDDAPGELIFSLTGTREFPPPEHRLTYARTAHLRKDGALVYLVR